MPGGVWRAEGLLRSRPSATGASVRLHLALAHVATARLAQMTSGYALRRAVSDCWHATRQPSTIHPVRRSEPPQQAPWVMPAVEPVTLSLPAPVFWHSRNPVTVEPASFSSSMSWPTTFAFRK
jgi:hypothetical protein